MKHISLLLALFGVACAELVVEISSEEQFDAFLEAEATTLIEFYAPWCGHCKKLLPEFEAAASTLEEEGISLAKVDCTTEDNKPVCSRFDVTGYPTVKFFRSGTASAYEGGRVAADIVNFVQSRSGPLVRTLETEEDAKAFVANGIHVVKFAAESSTSFEEAAGRLLDDMTFAVVLDVSVAKALGAEMDTVVLFRDFDEPKLTYVAPEGEDDEGHFDTWCRKATVPVLGDIGPDNYKEYMSRGIPLLWVATLPDESLELLDLLRELAVDYTTDFSAVRIDGNQYKPHVKNLGLDEDNLPGVIITDGSLKYIFSDDDFSRENVLAFMKGFVNGELTSFRKSAPVPENNDGPVIVLVGDSFEELVTENTEADILVEFYAPWCGHCKKLEPEFDDLGERFASNDNIVIAKMDSTENDGPLEIKGFPTLYLFPASGGEPIQYKGGRTADDIEQWLLSSAPILQSAEAEDSDESITHDDL